MRITVRVFDISHGMARTMSMSFLGIHLDIVPHTSIIAFGREYWFGSTGVQCEAPYSGGATGSMQVHQTLELGETQIPPDVFEDFLAEIQERFVAERYNLIHHNCNHFTHEVSLFLLGVGLPSEIVELPQRVLATPQGAALCALFSQMGPAMDPMARNATAGSATAGSATAGSATAASANPLAGSASSVPANAHPTAARPSSNPSDNPHPSAASLERPSFPSFPSTPFGAANRVGGFAATPVTAPPVGVTLGVGGLPPAGATPAGATPAPVPVVGGTPQTAATAAPTAGGNLPSATMAPPPAGRVTPGTSMVTPAAPKGLLPLGNLASGSLVTPAHPLVTPAPPLVTPAATSSRSPELHAAQPLRSLQGPTAAVLTKLLTQLEQNKKSTVARAEGDDKNEGGDKNETADTTASQVSQVSQLGVSQLSCPETIDSTVASRLGCAFAALLRDRPTEEHFSILFLSRLLVLNDAFLAAWWRCDACKALTLESRSPPAAGRRAAHLMALTTLSNAASSGAGLGVLLGDEQRCGGSVRYGGSVRAGGLVLEKAIEAAKSDDPQVGTKNIPPTLFPICGDPISPTCPKNHASFAIFDPQVAQAAAALLHNVSLGVPPGAEPSPCDSTGISLDVAEEIWLQLLSGLPVALRAQRDAEAQRRLLIALGQVSQIYTHFPHMSHPILPIFQNLILFSRSCSSGAENTRRSSRLRSVLGRVCWESCQRQWGGRWGGWWGVVSLSK